GLRDLHFGLDWQSQGGSGTPSRHHQSLCLDVAGLPLRIGRSLLPENLLDLCGLRLGIIWAIASGNPDSHCSRRGAAAYASAHSNSGGSSRDPHRAGAVLTACNLGYRWRSPVPIVHTQDLDLQWRTTPCGVSPTLPGVAASQCPAQPLWL